MSVGSNVVIGAGARVRETILLDGAELKVCVMHGILVIKRLIHSLFTISHDCSKSNFVISMIFYPLD